MNFKFLDKNKGYTQHHFLGYKVRSFLKMENSAGYIGIPELLVVMVIIAILTIIALINYPAAKKQLALQRSASQLAQDIRRVQEMALASEEVGGAIPEGGYGIYLKTVPAAVPQTTYILFADQSNDKKCDGCEDNPPGGETIIPPGKISLENGIKILNVPTNHLHIIFKPPDPTTSFTTNDGGDIAGPGVLITLSLISDETKTKIIRVNKAGLIYVE